LPGHCGGAADDWAKRDTITAKIALQEAANARVRESFDDSGVMQLR
jgi:hypothetical protein